MIRAQVLRGGATMMSLTQEAISARNNSHEVRDVISREQPQPSLDLLSVALIHPTTKKSPGQAQLVRCAMSGRGTGR